MNLQIKPLDNGLFAVYENDGWHGDFETREQAEEYCEVVEAEG